MFTPFCQWSTNNRQLSEAPGKAPCRRRAYEGLWIIVLNETAEIEATPFGYGGNNAQFHLKINRRYKECLKTTGKAAYGHGIIQI